MLPSEPRLARRALLRMMVGFTGAAAGAWLAIRAAAAASGPSAVLPFLLPAAASFASGGAGLLELLTRTPFQRTAGAWMALRRWQRGVLGTLIVLAALALFLLLVAVVTGQAPG